MPLTSYPPARMNTAMLTVMVRSELRLRLRRFSSMITILVLIVLTWLMVVDQKTGLTLLCVDGARFLYDSAALALGSAVMGAMLFSLAGFYLVRGRTGEDMRAGCAAVLAASPVSNSAFLLGRWLGGVLYLTALLLPFLLTMLIMQRVRGVGPIMISPYLQTYALVLLPTIMYIVSLATLFDACAPLMGKRGDVLYFFLWAAQFSLLPLLANNHFNHFSGWSALLLIDFSGLISVITQLAALFHASTVNGIAPFNQALPALTMPPDFWTAKLMFTRMAAAILGCLPLLLAIAVFHRYSPDRVKYSKARRRGSLAAVINRLLRPFSRAAQPLFALAARVPGLGGHVLAELALTLAVNPAAILALAGFTLIGTICVASALPGILTAAIGFWGILISDLSTRDYQADLEPMTAAVAGGAQQRYLRQWLASVLLGLALAATVLLRWLAHQPLRALALVSGVLMVSALASLLGRTSRTSRTFLALFLSGLYLSLNVTGVAAFDFFGINGAATAASITLQCWIGLAACAAGIFYHRQRAQ
jgi:hypothetical protein